MLHCFMQARRCAPRLSVNRRMMKGRAQRAAMEHAILLVAAVGCAEHGVGGSSQSKACAILEWAWHKVVTVYTMVAIERCTHFFGGEPVPA